MDEVEARKRYINEPIAPHSLNNPHPLYGKDPNIMNEFGHTHYPKWVYPNGENNAAVLANDAKHEKALMSVSVEVDPDPSAKVKTAWNE